MIEGSALGDNHPQGYLRIARSATALRPLFSFLQDQAAIWMQVYLEQPVRHPWRP